MSTTDAKKRACDNYRRRNREVLNAKSRAYYRANKDYANRQSKSNYKKRKEHYINQLGGGVHLL